MKKLSLFSYFNENVMIRNAMKKFLSDIEKSKEKSITLDFKDIKFVSRSCADEYLSFLDNSNKEITIINISPDVARMINVVKENFPQITFIKESCNSSKLLYS